MCFGSKNPVIDGDGECAGTSINNEDMVKCSQLVLEAVTIVGVEFGMANLPFVL